MKHAPEGVMLSQPPYLPKGNPLLQEMNLKKKRLRVAYRSNVLRTRRDRSQIMEANVSLVTAAVWYIDSDEKGKQAG